MNKTILLCAMLLCVVTCFNVPGIPSNYYKDGDLVYVKTRKLTSIHDLPFDFYSLKFCHPEPIEFSAENLGEYMLGDRVENSVYNFQFNKDVTCKRITPCKPKLPDGEDVDCPYQIVCPKQTVETIEDFKHRIDESYEAQMIVDNLPLANRQDPYTECGNLPPTLDEIKQEQQLSSYARPDGFNIGCRDKIQDGDPEKGTKDVYKYYINNHLTFVIYYHKRENQPGLDVIVGAEVFPSSIAHNENSCSPDKPLARTLDRFELKDGVVDIPFSYSVVWKESATRFASRWDAYLQTADNSEDYKIHWFSIVNSLMIVLFLTGMVAMIMLRVLHKDIQFYNRADDEDPTDETGWKLVHGDVFRTPPFYSLLSVYAGSGVQVFGMTVITLVFALLGFLSPANRGGLFTVMLLLFVFMGVFAGYQSLRLYKTFKGESWKLVSLMTAFMFPGIIFLIFLFVNVVSYFGIHSTAAVPFTILLSFIGLWFGISVPLVFLGGYFGYKKQEIEFPTPTHRIRRQIPPQPTYMKSPIAILMGGILPFGAVFIELYFIMSSIWLHKYYLVFGFLFIVFAILVVTCAEITIVLIYFQLCNEDYRWWWRSYLSSGSSALYLFLYAVFYYFSTLQIDNMMMMILYFGYTLIISYTFFVLTGTIGFFSCLWFTRRIYGSIKVA